MNLKAGDQLGTYRVIEPIGARRHGRVRGLLIGVLLCLSVAHRFDGQSGGQGARRGDSRPRDITVANATGAAAEVLALEQKIEAAVVKGDVAFAESVLSSDFISVMAMDG